MTCFLHFLLFWILFLLMMDIAKFKMCKNFTILNQALQFLIKLHKTAVQSVPKIDKFSCQRFF